MYFSFLTSSCTQLFITELLTFPLQCLSYWLVNFVTIFWVKYNHSIVWHSRCSLNNLKTDKIIIEWISDMCCVLINLMCHWTIEEKGASDSKDQGMFIKHFKWTFKSRDCLDLWLNNKMVKIGYQANRKKNNPFILDWIMKVET